MQLKTKDGSTVRYGTPFLLWYGYGMLVPQDTYVGTYLGVAFTSEGRQDEELDTRIGKASAVMRDLHYSVVMKRELSKQAKLSIFKAVFVPILTYLG